MDKVLAGKTINVNEEGYLKDFSQWNQEVGAAIAIEEGIEMTDKHWEVIDYIQEQFKKEVALSIRSIKKSGVIDIKSFYALFPKGPLKKSTKIAGIPKPKSCV